MASSEAPGGELELRLGAVAYGAQGINLYRFDAPDGAALPAFEPGAHVDVQACGAHRRQYSLLWPPAAPGSYTIAVQVAEDGRGGSRALHYDSVVGRHYRLSAPRNHFGLAAGARRYVLFAGGIGITPIVSMYRRLRQDGAAVELHYWSANRARTLFLDELRDAPGVHLHHAETRPVDGAPSPRIGDVIRDLPMDAQLYCCGPDAMLAAFDAACANRPAGMAHRERFGVDAAALLPADTFQVRLARSGRTLTVDAGQTLLQACLEAGVDVSYSCEEGVCGACEVKVLAGEIAHRDSILTPEQRRANRSMMLCCSRGAGTSLVLDL
ncbi:PDR/VanB family oxidoreductase [Burkholderia sp. Ac-20379]|uniref:PDR/VanB family oxidoreductase n=1 Tax=Burkholderia sp. Ac-20379 TaxID=2703900 RepID=UPI00197E2E9E|nr:PDR/VanB family oxidoreductase [Burkholderia sp. Ac-20379]MBN3725138.1 oxidoreductase [Burkholderia sp. Ac-20379]